MAKKYHIIYGDEEVTVEQDTPLRAVEEIVGHEIGLVTINGVEYDVVELEEE